MKLFKYYFYYYLMSKKKEKITIRVGIDFGKKLD